ncbi:MAG: type II CAAX endopeptidase family protein [Opitutales bacterium]
MTAEPSSPPAPAGLPAWSARPLDFALWLWLLWCVLVISQAAASPLARHFPADSLAAAVILGAASQIASLAIQVFLLLCVPFLSPRPLDAAWISRRHAVIRGLLDFLVALPLILIVKFVWGIVLYYLHEMQPSLDLSPQEAVLLFVNGGNPWLLAAFALLAVALAPINEELLFRGGLYRFIKSLGRPRLALAVSSLLFGLAHFNLLEFLPLVLIGALLVRTYERTGRIIAPIAFHAAFNATNIALMLLVRAFNW